MTHVHPSRRSMLRGGLATLAALVSPSTLVGCGTTRRPPDGDTDEPMVEWPPLRSLIDQVGPLGDANADGLRLPPGFTARIVARTGEEVVPGGHRWHAWPDGGACFATREGG